EQVEVVVKRALEHQELLRSKRYYENFLEEMVKQRTEEYKKRYEELAGQRANSVVMSFDFPEEIKVPCEQYLIYFAQFLKDLGVEANTSLTHEAGQVLYTVTPINKHQALDKIYQALNVYLHLSSSPVS